MTLIIYTDGGSRGNPGPASIGVVAYLNGAELFSCSKSIGIATNNVAEYTAVITALEMVGQHIETNDITEIQFNSDSKLLVEQLSGRYKVKTPHIQVLFSQVKELEMWVGLPVTYKWIQRSENEVADSLVNRAHQ